MIDFRLTYMQKTKRSGFESLWSICDGKLISVVWIKGPSGKRHWKYPENHRALDVGYFTSIKSKNIVSERLTIIVLFITLDYCIILGTLNKVFSATHTHI